jgi:type IV pilus assembly protein PilE
MVMSKRKFRQFMVGSKGFTLIELMVVIAIIGILSAIAYPNYTDYILKGHRTNAQSELLQLAGTQERIFLNSNSYSPTLVGIYNGTGAGGLGLTAARTEGGTGRYDLSMTMTPLGCAGTLASPCQAFVILAAPRPGQSKDSFGTMSLATNGTKTRNVGGGTLEKPTW